MEITGERALENITESQAFTLVVAQPDQDDIALDALFEALDTHIADPNFIHLALTINGGIAAGGTTLTLENPLVSQSQLKIALASSVTAYQDDPDSVKSKIAQWFTAQLQVIVDQQAVAAAEITED